jgi:hypothetical protein
MKSKALRLDIDVIAALVGFVIGAVGVLASEYYNLNRSHLGYAVCAACLGYLVTSNLLPVKESVHREPKWQTLDRLFIFATILFLILLLVSIAVLTRSLYRRPPVYLGLVLGATILLVLQMALFDPSARWKQLVLLGQILLMAVSLRAGAFFLFPSMSGNDPFVHQRWIDELIVTGKFPQDASYASYPILHLLAGATSLIYSTSSEIGLFSVSTLHSIALLAVFAIGKTLFDPRTGLIAALLLSLSDYQILWGIQVIPNSLGIVWFLLVLMALVKREDATHPQGKLGWTISILLFLWAMLFTHTLSTFVLLIVLLTLLATTALFPSSRFSSRSTVVSVTLVGLFGVAMVAYWMWSFPTPERDFFTRMVLSTKYALSSAQLGRVEMVTVAGSLDAWTVFAGEAGWTLLLAPALMGALSSFNPRMRRTQLMVWAPLMAVFLGIIYGSGLMGVQAVLPARWMAFLYVPACLLAASFLSQLLAISERRPLISSFTVLLLSAVSVLMITSPSKSIPDSPLYAASLGTRPGLYTSELAGMRYAENTYHGPFAASAHSRRFLRTANIIDPRQPDSYESANLIIVRTPDISTGFFIPHAKHQLNEIVLPTQELFDHLNGPSRVRVYDNGAVQLFLSTSYADAVEHFE